MDKKIHQKHWDEVDAAVQKVGKIQRKKIRVQYDEENILDELDDLNDEDLALEIKRFLR